MPNDTFSTLDTEPASEDAQSTGATGMLARARGNVKVLALFAFILVVLGLIAPLRAVSLTLLGSGAGIGLLAALMAGLNRKHAARQGVEMAAISRYTEQDTTPCIVASADGAIVSMNRAAHTAFSDAAPVTLAAALSKRLANPGGILFRLQKRAQVAQAAQEDLVTRSGHVRLSVQKLGEDAFVWRVDEIERRAAPRHPQDSLQLPMLMIGRNDTILFMNDTARNMVGERSKSLDRLFPVLPLRPGEVTELSTLNGPRDVLLAQVSAGAGRRAVYLLDPPEGAQLSRPNWQVFEDIPVPMIKVAPEGHILSFNPMATELIGVRLEEGVHISQLMEGLGRPIADWLKDSIADRLSQKSEFLKLTRADKEAFVQVTLHRVTEEGKVALVAVINDATELKSLEAQFVQSQKMQAIGQLAGGVAHDFNNLLTAISGHCDLLLLRHDQGDADYNDLVQISQNANRAAALVRQLLAFSRKQTLRPETLDMRDTLADLTHLLNRLVGERITLTLSHDPVLKPIRADKRQLEQVLMNLVVNARDAMPAGGEIKIITECRTLDEPMHRDRVAVPAGEYVTVQVVDFGVGIPPDKQQKVFEPFVTTKRTGEGTGLGLSTAYGIVKQTGGFIFLDSVVGEGTQFTLYFPVLDVQKPARAQKDTPESRVAAKTDDGVILLVEDEAPVRAFASRALRLRGYTVLEAESAEAALRTLEDAELDIDVFVTDVVMPGMDGPSWVREALKDRPDVRVVFVSGYAEDSFDETQASIPNSVFLPKPFSLNDLTDTVHKQMH